MRCGPANPKALVTLLMNTIYGLTKNSITCLSPDPSINTLFQTCLIISFLDQTDVKGFVKGFYWWSYRMMNCNVASCKNISNSTLKRKKPHPFYDQNGQNPYSIYDQHGWKTIPFGTPSAGINQILGDFGKEAYSLLSLSPMQSCLENLFDLVENFEQ